MKADFATKLGSNDCYLNRIPERLVLEGYRHQSAGYETGSIRPWEMVWGVYVDALGLRDAKRAMAELSNFVRVLQRCATCPLRAFPFQSHHLCTEECLVLGLIAGFQHDDGAADICIEHLCCSFGREEIGAAAYLFASTLRELGQVMLPVPPHVIADITKRQMPVHATSAGLSSSNYH